MTLGNIRANACRVEDVYKIYAESFRSEDHLKQVQHDAQALIGRLFNKA
jgi:phosphoglucomutase